jgi:hypothetical protein
MQETRSLPGNSLGVHTLLPQGLTVVQKDLSIMFSGAIYTLTFWETREKEGSKRRSGNFEKLR